MRLRDFIFLSWGSSCDRPPSEHRLREPDRQARGTWSGRRALLASPSPAECRHLLRPARCSAAPVPVFPLVASHLTSARTARFTPSPAASASGPGRVRPRLARVPGHLARSGRGQPPWGCVAPGLETALRISASKIQRRGRGGPSARQCSASTVRWALCRGRGFEATPGPHCNSAGGAARVLLGVQFRRAARLVGWGR